MPFYLILHKMAYCSIAPCAEQRRSGNLGIPQSAKIIDNALSLTPGWGIDGWLEGHKSDSCGSSWCHTLTRSSRSPIKSSHLQQHVHTRTHTSQYTVKKKCLESQINSNKYTSKAPNLHFFYIYTHPNPHILTPHQQDDSTLKMAG